MRVPIALKITRILFYPAYYVECELATKILGSATSSTRPVASNKWGTRPSIKRWAGNRNNS